MIVVGALIAAIDPVSQHDTVPADLAVAVAAARGEGAHRAFEAVEGVYYTTQADFKTVHVLVSTDFTTLLPSCILCVTHKYPRGMESLSETSKKLTA